MRKGKFGEITRMQFLLTRSATLCDNYCIMVPENDNIVEICGKIYDIVEQNMRADGGVLRLTREHFLGFQSAAPGEIDLRPARDASNFQFFNYVFSQLFGPKPPEALLEHWGDDIWHLSRPDFRRRFMTVVRNVLASEGRELTIVE